MLKSMLFASVLAAAAATVLVIGTEHPLTRPGSAGVDLSPKGERGVAETGLRELDAETIERLRRLSAGSPDPEIRWAATQLLVKAQDPETLFLLQDRIIKDDDAGVRLAALEALVEFDDPAALPIYQEALKDKDPKVRAAAKAALKPRSP